MQLWGMRALLGQETRARVRFPPLSSGDAPILMRGGNTLNKRKDQARAPDAEAGMTRSEATEILRQRIRILEEDEFENAFPSVARYRAALRIAVAAMEKVMKAGLDG